jgi:nitroimidazol reductase NimA-like FMN-containing flavoprotein (pyridoxamine 5'-phosphate oxidase superfamily)
MIVHELSEPACREILARTHVARIACSRQGQPYIVPISYDFDGGALYSFATLGQKIIWMRENPRVCVEVDDIDGQFDWTTVLVFGRYEELRGDEYTRARDRAQGLFTQREQWWLPATAKTNPPEHHVPIVYRIVIERMTGRRANRA